MEKITTSIGRFEVHFEPTGDFYIPKLIGEGNDTQISLACGRRKSSSIEKINAVLDTWEMSFETIKMIVTGAISLSMKYG